MSDRASPVAVLTADVDDRVVDSLARAADLVSGRRFREAEAELLQALAVSPGDVRALKLLAVVRFKSGRLEEARVACEELAAVLPDDAGVRIKLGLIALRLERFAESIDALEAATRLAPEDAKAWSYLGYACVQHGDRVRAAQAFRRAGQDALAGELESAARSSASTGDGESEDAAYAGYAASEEVVPVGHTPSAQTGSPDHRYEAGSDTDPEFAPEPSEASPFLRESALEAPPEVRPLVMYAAARLVPDSGGGIEMGGLVRLPLDGELIVRADAVVACRGTVRTEPAQRRVRGRELDEPLGGPSRPFFRFQGHGDVLLAPAPWRLIPLMLTEDVLYAREECVLAFDAGLAWEHGRAPRTDLAMLQLRGTGLLAVQAQGEPAVVKVTPERPVFAKAECLIGWIGHVVTRGDGAADASSLRLSPFGLVCEGEGVVLLDVGVKQPTR